MLKHTLILLSAYLLVVQSNVIPIALEKNPEEGDLFEGDILGVDPLRGINQKASIRWPDGIVPYVIDNSVNPYTVAEVTRILFGIQLLQDLTRVGDKDCIKIVPRTTEKYFVRVVKGSGCSSYVGQIQSMTEGQQLSLAAGCLSNGTIMHEFIHALGFTHEQSRPDRDNHIDVFYENMQPGTENNFRKLLDEQAETFGFPYDYGSVMHYSKTGFSINGLPTILPKDPNAVIGQRVTLSPIDIGEIRTAYNCN